MEPTEPYSSRSHLEGSWPCELHFVYAFIYARACRLQLPRTSECGQESKIEIGLRKLAQPAEASFEFELISFDDNQSLLDGDISHDTLGRCLELGISRVGTIQRKCLLYCTS
jgi:hypothetical protein